MVLKLVVSARGGVVVWFLRRGLRLAGPLVCTHQSALKDAYIPGEGRKH